LVQKDKRNKKDRKMLIGKKMGRNKKLNKKYL